MEKKNLKVVTSSFFDFIDIPSIHDYGTGTFGLKLEDYFIDEIYIRLEDLSKNYLLHPECRHLERKQKNTVTSFLAPIVLALCVVGE